MRQADDQPHDKPQASRRLSVQEAADVLGVTVDAVRGRIKRRTLASTKGEDGSVYVLLEEGIGADQSNGESQPSYDRADDQSQLIERMATEIEFLRGELQRKDAILLSMTEGLKALEAPSEAREAPLSSSEDPDKGYSSRRSRSPHSAARGGASSSASSSKEPRQRNCLEGDATGGTSYDTTLPLRVTPSY